MEERRGLTCCFTGHRPEKLPWGNDEGSAPCVALKASLARELEGLYRRGFCRYITGMARGCDLYFAEAVLALREKHPEVVLEAVVPFRGQADRWRAAEQARYRRVLERCGRVTVLREDYVRGCMQERNRRMVDSAQAILAVFDGASGGTQYTLNYALSRGLEFLLLNVNAPEREAVRLVLPEEKDEK